MAAGKLDIEFRANRVPWPQESSEM